MLANNFVSTWQRLIDPRRSSAHSAATAPAAIHRFNPTDDAKTWSRCRDRAQFHLGRARRAKDRGHFDDAAREIERALRYDDTSEAYFVVLGQCYLRRQARDYGAARWAFERALAINPRNGYALKLLLEVHTSEGNEAAARGTVERALAAGAPVGPWTGRPNFSGQRLGAGLTASA